MNMIEDMPMSVSTTSLLLRCLSLWSLSNFIFSTCVKPLEREKSGINDLDRVASTCCHYALRHTCSKDRKRHLEDKITLGMGFESAHLGSPMKVHMRELS